MIKYFLKKLFRVLIGNLTEKEKAEFWHRFNTLMTDIAEAAAKGAIEGAVKK